MTIKKVDGYATVHCHGKDKGKIIHKFKTKKEALAQHRAIMASKHKHHSASDGKFLETRRRKFGA
jgi:hypothetical protein